MDSRVQATITSYNRIAPEYDRQNRRYFLWREEYDLLKKRIQDKQVLEIGCGGGRDARVFLKDKFEYLGIDASKGLLKVARKNNPSGTFRLMDLFDLRFPKQSYGAIWSMATLLHVPKYRLPKVLRSIHALLKPNGFFVVSIKQKRNLDQAVIHQDRYGGVDRFFAFYSNAEFLKVLKKAGFRVLKSWKRHDDGNIWLSYVTQAIN